MSSTPPNPYYYAKGWIALPYELGEIAPSIKIDGEILYVKPEFHFHMSIFPVKDWLAHWAEKSPEEAESALLNEAAKLLKQFPVTILKLRGEYRLAQKEDRKTVVVMCEAINIDKFAEGMGKFLGIEIPVQPAHITLYTRKSNGSLLGIGLGSTEELEEISRPLSGEETKAVEFALSLNHK